MHCMHGATNMVIDSQALSRACGIKTVCHSNKKRLQNIKNILEADERNKKIKRKLHKLYTGKRQDETVLEDLLYSNNFYYLFKTMYAALDLLETLLTTLFMCNDSRSTF